MTLLAAAAIRSAVLMALGLIASAGLRKRSAALRHRVLVLSLLAAALVLPLNLLLPEWTVKLPAPAPESTHATESTPTIAAVPSAATSSTGSAVVESRQSDFAFVSPLLVLWLAGMSAAVGTVVAGLVRVRRAAAVSHPVDEGQWLQILGQVAERYRLTRAIAISRTDAADLLATWGILRPHVLLPLHSRDWTLERVHAVLCHELAHIRRHDWVVQLAAEALRAVFWFNPLAWMLCTRLRRESEQACDDEVLACGVSARDYAGHLLDLAKQCRRTGPLCASAVPMAHPSTLERRIAAMLNPRLDRSAPSRRVLGALAVLLLLVALPMAAVRARQAGPAALIGTIYDVTGAVLPGVEVTLVDANEITQAVTSDASGRFEFPPVAAGKYVLETKLAGFRTLRHPFELREARDWERVVTLQVGDLRETIMVRGSRVTLPKQPKTDTAEPQRVRVGGNIRPPRKILDVKPIYPETMRTAGLTGEVPIEAIIGRDGTVSSVRVLSAQVHPDFAIAAVDAVRQWRFTPTLLNGAQVEVVMTVSVRFDLEG